MRRAKVPHTANPTKRSSPCGGPNFKPCWQQGVVGKLGAFSSSITTSPPRRGSFDLFSFGGRKASCPGLAADMPTYSLAGCLGFVLP